MTIEEPWAGLTGSWTGRNYLWLGPSEPVRESLTMAEVGSVAGGNYLTINYNWVEDGPQDGLILINTHPAASGASSVWLDSWHTAPGLMSLTTAVDEHGTAVLEGSYPAPSGPDWGWRIVIEPHPGHGFQLQMFNITPDGDALRAVEATYRRLAPVD